MKRTFFEDFERERTLNEFCGNARKRRSQERRNKNGHKTLLMEDGGLLSKRNIVNAI